MELRRHPITNDYPLAHAGGVFFLCLCSEEPKFIDCESHNPVESVNTDLLFGIIILQVESCLASLSDPSLASKTLLKIIFKEILRSNA